MKTQHRLRPDPMAADPVQVWDSPTPEVGRSELEGRAAAAEPQRQRPQRLQRRGCGSLRFTPYAWAKLLWFRDHDGCGEQTEIGGFGRTNPHDPLLVEDILIVRQTVTAVSVKFDDLAVADLFESQIDQGRRPEQFARIWLHTHPGDSPRPSAVDEQTFQRVFGSCDWAVMAIVARGGQGYARLCFNVGPGGELLLPIQVDFGQPFPGSDPAAWQEEYQRHITVPEAVSASWPDWAEGLEPADWPGMYEMPNAELAF